MRLINSAKNELGRISKAILENINKRLCARLNVNQWKNTASVIEWFKIIEQKHLYKFKILYIHKDSNHPLSILNQISKSIEKRISTLSSNETIFNESKEIYQKALEKSGYRQTLKYHPSNENVTNNKRNRKRIVTWF